MFLILLWEHLDHHLDPEHFETEVHFILFNATAGFQRASFPVRVLQKPFLETACCLLYVMPLIKLGPADTNSCNPEAFSRVENKVQFPLELKSWMLIISADSQA